MKKLLEQIEETQKLPGWCTLAKANTLASMVIALRPEISIELGIFSGRSFLPLALAHKFIGKGCAIGVEPWSTEAASEGYTGANKTWWGSLDMASIQKGFLKQIDLLAIQNVVKIVQMKSADYEPPQGIGLLHVDGQHTDQAVREVKWYSPCVKIGGIIVLDDLHWSNDGKTSVATASQWLLEHGYEELYSVFNKPQGGQDDWGVYQKLKI